MTLWARPSCVSAKLAVIVFIHLQCHWRVLFLGRRFFLRGCGRRSLKVQLNDARSVSEECNVDSICITFHCRCVFLLIICIWHSLDRQSSWWHKLQCGILWIHDEGGNLLEGMRWWRIMSILRNPNMNYKSVAFMDDWAMSIDWLWMKKLVKHVLGLCGE